MMFSFLSDYAENVLIFNIIPFHRHGTVPFDDSFGIYHYFSSAGPTADSLKQWLVVFEGESGSLYEGGTFFALLTFDDDYPFTPPTVIIYSVIFLSFFHFS